ncbi:MAG: hypothetical protein J1F65_05430 [Clostridiales bacterium]|nr:hypothetical protein [Clostridiales bacterium]
MKTRRALQIIVGVLSLLLVACLIVAALAIVFLLYARDGAFETGSAVASAFYQGQNIVAEKLGLTEDLSFVVSLLAYGLPCLLFFLAAVLLFVHKTPKQAKYVAGSALALIAVTILTVYTIVCAPQLVYGQDWESHAEFSWTALDTIVRFASAGLLGIFVIFAGSALGVKPKREKVAASDESVASEAEPSTEQEIEQSQPEEVSADEAEEQTEAVEPTIEEPLITTDVEEPQEAPVEVEEAQIDETPATEYVPQTDVTVNDVVANTYGAQNEELSPEAVAKINKLRLLLATNAITEQEYVKLVNIYLGKK